MKIIVIPTTGDHCESVTTKINVKILIKNLQECFFFPFEITTIFAINNPFKTHKDDFFLHLILFLVVGGL